MGWFFLVDSPGFTFLLPYDSSDSFHLASSQHNELSVHSADKIVPCTYAG
jgi:hypothetical protein